MEFLSRSPPIHVLDWNKLSSRLAVFDRLGSLGCIYEAVF